MISCAYCGAGHATPAEVKACWARTEGGVQAPVRAPQGMQPGAPAAVPPGRLADLHELLWSESLGDLDGPAPPPRWAMPIDNGCAAELAPDQMAAVTHPGGSARIIAPAGSGKTRVLTERARHLLTRWNVPPGALTVVAYNKRAQEEIVARTADLPRLQVRTLNALALAIVNGRPPFAPQPVAWRTIDEREVRAILGRLVERPRKLNTDPYAPWFDALSVARLGLVEPAQVEAQFGGDVPGFSGVFDRFRDVLAQQRVVDFDEQILRAVELLRADATAREAAQAACRVLLVDEFQDLTPAHLLLIRLLAGGGGHVFAVGDDDQTIYGYNGADPRWLIDFARWFPGAGDHPLEVNYRCPAGVVDAADRLLRHNRRRVPKTIRAAAGASTGGWQALGSDDPVAATTATVQAALQAGAAPSDVAVLSRVNVALVPVRVALGLAGVTVRSGEDTAFVGTTSVRSVLAWLRLATSAELDPGDLDEALKRPARSLHPAIRNWVLERRSVAGLQQLSGRLTKPKEAEAVATFAADIARVRSIAERGTTERVVAAVIGEVGLGNAVGRLDTGKHGTNSAAQSDALQAVLQLARLHPDPAGFEPWLHRQLSRPGAPDGVTLATVHRVKGQEWAHVVVHLADADQFPHRLADDREEERRLFHVALTRASRQVTLVSGPEPSPFVAELNADPPDLDTVPPGPTTVTRSAELVEALARSRPADGLEGRDRARFELLREWRKGVAEGKPAYTVFDDKTLVAIARSDISNLAHLAAVRGVGPAKLEQYGEQVLALLSGQADIP